MTTLPRFGSKVIREIRSGVRDSNGRKKVNPAEVFAKAKARDQKQREEIAAIKPIENSQQMSAAEFQAYVKQQAGSVVKRSAKKPRSPLMKAEDKAWKPFSLFIRLRDADANGIVKCCTCGVYRHYKRMQAGHYITRAKKATLFYENNSHGQCPACNLYQGGKPIEYELFIDRKYGAGTAEKIRIDAVKECRRTIEQLQEIQERYRLKVEQIKDHEPNKFKSAA